MKKGREFKSRLDRQGVYAVSGSPGPIRIVPNGLISRLEPASSWGDLLAQAEDLQNLARNRRDPSFRFTGGARECEVDASQTQLDGREMPPLTGSFARCNASTEKGLRCEQNSQEWSRCPF
jgi:hypothetical protein